MLYVVCGDIYSCVCRACWRGEKYTGADADGTYDSCIFSVVVFCRSLFSGVFCGDTRNKCILACGELLGCTGNDEFCGEEREESEESEESEDTENAGMRNLCFLRIHCVCVSSNTLFFLSFSFSFSFSALFSLFVSALPVCAGEYSACAYECLSGEVFVFVSK